ncbi:MAG: nucleotidyltransferase family protein [Candidatus Woesearchaeota archaeon]
MDTYKEDFTILEHKLFDYLCIHSGEKFSQRELAKNLNVSPTAIGTSVKKLLKKKLIKINYVKRINFVFFNRENEKAINLKQINNLKNLYESNLYYYLKEELTSNTTILFGSYLRGEDHKNSDIDLAVFKKTKKQLELSEFERKLNRKININYYENVNELDKHLKNNIVNGFVLFGGLEL